MLVDNVTFLPSGSLILKTVEQIDLLQLMWGNEIHVKSKCVLAMYFPHNSHAELIMCHQYLFSHLPRGQIHIKICNKQKIRVHLLLRHLCGPMCICT